MEIRIKGSKPVFWACGFYFLGLTQLCTCAAIHNQRVMYILTCDPRETTQLNTISLPKNKAGLAYMEDHKYTARRVKWIYADDLWIVACWIGHWAFLHGLHRLFYMVGWDFRYMRSCQPGRLLNKSREPVNTRKVRVTLCYITSKHTYTPIGGCYYCLQIYISFFNTAPLWFKPLKFFFHDTQTYINTPFPPFPKMNYLVFFSSYSSIYL